MLRKWTRLRVRRAAIVALCVLGGAHATVRDAGVGLPSGGAGATYTLDLGYAHM